MKSFVLLLFLLVVVSFLPARAMALPTGLPFGGLTTALIPCTCPPFGFLLIETPLFLGADVPVAGSIYYPPGALIFAFFQLLPGTFDLGTMAPGGACLVLAPIPTDPCIVLPAAGTIEYTGTSSLAPASLLDGLF